MYRMLLHMNDRVVYEIKPAPDGGWVVLRPLSARITEFRAERISKISAGSTPASLEPGPLAVLHFVPHISLDRAFDLDIRPFANGIPNLKPLGSHGWNHRFNADGFLLDSPTRDGK